MKCKFIFNVLLWTQQRFDNRVWKFSTSKHVVMWHFPKTGWTCSVGFIFQFSFILTDHAHIKPLQETTLWTFQYATLTGLFPWPRSKTCSNLRSEGETMGISFFHMPLSIASTLERQGRNLKKRIPLGEWNGKISHWIWGSSLLPDQMPHPFVVVRSPVSWSCKAMQATPHCDSSFSSVCSFFPLRP